MLRDRLAEGPADVFLTRCIDEVAARRQTRTLQVIGIPAKLAVGADCGPAVSPGAEIDAHAVALFIPSQTRPRRPERKGLTAPNLPYREAMKLSARNVLAGKVVDVKRGATTSHVRIEIAGGVVITASITNEAVDDLGLKVGDAASAIIKASEVIVGKH